MYCKLIIIITQVKTDGVKLVIASVTDASKMANGLSVDNERYILIRSDPGVVIVLKKGPNGIVAYKSSQSNILFFRNILLNSFLKNF